MRPMISLTLILLVSGCATGSLEAFCESTRKTADELKTALLQDGGDASVVAGANLLSEYDGACR